MELYIAGKSVLCAKLDVFKAAIGILGHCNILVDSAELEVTAFLGLPHTSGHVMSDACRVDSIRVALDDLNPGTAIRIVSEGTAPEACTKKAYRWDLSFGADPEASPLATKEQFAFTSTVWSKALHNNLLSCALNACPHTECAIWCPSLQFVEGYCSALHLTLQAYH